MFRTLGAAIVGLATLAADIAGAAETAPGTSDEIVALQRRLADAGCYAGALDGAKGPALDAAVKACPDMKPFLRVETGMHGARIWRIDPDANCARLATSSDDKTVRLWSLPDGKLERTVRLPIGDGNGGKIFAAALSPNGKTLAAGGWDAHVDRSGSVALTVVDLASGAVRRLGDLPNVISSVAFSLDGARVAVGLHGNDGVREFEVGSGRQIGADPNYGAPVYGIAFGADGALFAASDDGRVRRYGADGRLQARSGALSGKAPFSVAIRPDGLTLAVSFAEEPKVAFLNARSLRPVASGDTKDLTTGDFSSLAWSRDGAVLAAAGQARMTANGASYALVRRFDASGRRSSADVPAALTLIQDLRACGDGFVYASPDPAFGLIDARGEVRALQQPHSADMRDKKSDAFAVSDDGTRIRMGLEEHAGKPVLFDLNAATLSDAPTPPADLAVARVEGLAVHNWENNPSPAFGNVRIALDQFELSRALAIRRDSGGFTLATDYWVRAFDAAGREQWKRPGPSVAWGANYADNDRLILVAYGDGTIRWLRAEDGAELLAFFVEPQSRRWVAWTPSGYYMASPGGEDLIGWHLNRGWNQLADFFPASHFQGFNRPDIVQLVLSTRDEAEAVRQANAKSAAKPAPAPAAALPPVVTFVSASEDGRFSGATVEVSYRVRSPSGAAVDRVEALIDGRPLEGRGLAPVKEDTGDVRRLTVPAPPRDFQLSLIAHAGAMTSEPAIAKMTYAGAAPAEDAALKPKLYVVAIGVSDYADASLRLGFASDDARGFAEAIKAQAGGLYSDVEVLPPLVDRAVTRASVIKALGWLHKQTTARDIAMVLIAGHGAVDDASNYYFVPSDASADDLAASGVSKDDILREMGRIPGKAILFLDTCHANAAAAKGLTRGDVNINSIVNEFSRTENGLVVFSASTGKEVSHEDAHWGHGAFTKALIEGLGEGKADLLHHGRITLAELDAYIADRVKQLTDGEQHPVMTRPPTMPDFPFAMAR